MSTVPQTQRALLVPSLKTLTLSANHPIPTPGPNQVLLHVKIAGLNPHDRKARDTGLFIANILPAVLANDVVGTVVSLGHGVTSLSIGDRIVSHGGLTNDSSQNGLQEYALADIGACAKIPDGVTDDEAATLPVNVIASVVGLFRDLEIPAPWSGNGTFDYRSAMVLIIGGGSNCGKFAVQLARLAGIGRIVVVGGDETELKRMGATDVVDRHGGHDVVLQRVRGVVGDELVYVLDAVNPPDRQILGIDALSNTKPGIVARLLPNGPVDESRVKAGKKAGFEVRDVHGFSQLHPELTAPFWDALPGYLIEGKIRPLGYEVVEGLEVDVVKSVLDRYRDGERVVKTHVHLV
ncbi:hypothetical protein OQA88_10292 [Cercophora sp. LCS_1]